MASIAGPSGASDDTRRRGLFPMTVGLLGLLFVAAPWPAGHKAHMLLHGLCAQRPSHTFLMGSSPLPFDARMTGIYGGFLVTAAYLLLRGRHRRGRLPSVPAIALLAGFVLALAIDGFDSLLVDLTLRHPYEPGNVLRLLTGTATGISLAVVLGHLCAISLWRRPETTSPIVSAGDLFVIALLQSPFCLLVLAGPAWMETPATVLLLVSAVSVVSILALVVVVLWRRDESTFRSVGELHGHATAALLAGIAAMAGLAVGRFLLERWMGPSPLG